MYNKCCVVTCASRRKDVSFHMFPKSETGLKKWLQYINCERLRSLSFQELHKQFVCQKHFEKRFLSATCDRVRLCQDAYPTLFTSLEIASGVPNTDVSLPDKSEYIEIDHDYSRKRRHVDHTYCKMEVAKTKHISSETDEGTISSMQPLTSECQHKVIEPTEMIVDAISPLPSTSGYRRVNFSSDKPVCGTPKKGRHRLIYRKNKLSPHCTKLYKEYVKSRRQLNFNLRAKKALKFSKQKSFIKLTEKLNPIAKKFLWMQIKQSMRKARGRRFTDDEKLIAMAIMKQSPKCYRFLHRIFILPSKHTLNKFISKLDIQAGINPQIFEAIKKELHTWDEKKKYCSILFDEVALEAALSYDKHKDIINGFVELNSTSNDFADHALVFMLRGVVLNWQQPIAYYFCKGATSGVELKAILTSIISAVGNTGLIPLALVCDQGTAFQAALKNLQTNTRRQQILSDENLDDTIQIDEWKLHIIYDPPHLIKGLRNNFLTKNLRLNGQISKWTDIVEVYKTDCSHAQMRLLHKLNDEHVIPEKIKKMKVKNCTRVFSKTVAATLSYSAQFCKLLVAHYADGTPVSSTLRNTAEIVSFFDDLFDSVNGTSNISKEKPLRQAVTANSQHHQFWVDAIKKLQEIKFVDNHGKETSVPFH